MISCIKSMKLSMRKYYRLAVLAVLMFVLWSCGFQPGYKNSPSDKLATSEAKSLFKKMNSLRTRGVMFGQQDALAYGVGWKAESDNFISDVSLVSGQQPAVFGWDLGHIGDTCNIDGVSFVAMTGWIKEAHKKGGIITLSWHHLNPVSDSSAWELTPAVKQILPNGSHHQKFVNDLNHIADFFSGLRDENDNLIPVIFRPYHEFEGNWFWWCQNVTSSEEYIQLWKFTVDFFKGKGLHNILYCYNPGFVSDGIADSYYPGDDYVDLVGIDTYNLDTPIHIEEVDQIIERMIVFCNDHDKIPCISEAGYNGIPQQNWWTKTLAPLVKGKGISYVLLWRNARTDHFFVPFPGHESAPDFIQFIEDNAILSLGDMNRILQNNL